MHTFILKRLGQSLIVLVLVSVIIFLSVRILPGDPIYLIVQESNVAGASPEQLAQLRHEHGLDRHLIVQYFDWIGGVLRGDLGVSIFGKQPVADEVLRRLPITLELGLWSVLVSAAIGIPMGVISATRRGSWIDNAVILLSNIGITIPVFWFGLLLMLFFSLYLGWLPAMGWTPITDNVGLHLQQLVMPVICLSIFPIAAIARQTRSSLMEVIHQDYVRTAWAKGLDERAVIFRHALKNGLIPVITTIGLSARVIVGGSTVIETVFGIPGMGRLAVTAVSNKDFAVVQGVIVIIAATVILVNLLIDLAYGWVDPRIRYS
ncbi:ABC transporter permease [Devosia sp.]|uniref:ABC transporter permease n=1 Tax=Devosia sp. TaxID=1871048 RepID=UPI002AFE1C49|nr:ABC transporter permease [Devosia sp.]